MSIVPVSPFRKGVNLIDSPGVLSPDELSRCWNWRLGVRGELSTRPGFRKYGSDPQKVNGDNLVNLVFKYYRADSTKLLIAAAGGKLFKLNEATGAPTKININGSGSQSMSSSTLCSVAVYKDRVYIADGDKPQRYNGMDNLWAGHFIHATPTLVGSNSTGALTSSKTYQYGITSLASNMGEGPMGATASITLGALEDTVTLSAINSADSSYEVSGKRIYRTLADGSIFYLVGEIGAGIADFIDYMADASHGREYVPVKAPPADAKFVFIGTDERAYWFGMAGANASLVRASDVGFPDRLIDAEGFLSVNNNDGDVLNGGCKFPGGMLFFKRNSTWLLRAFGSGLVCISPFIGCTAPKSVVVVPGGVIFLSQSGRVYLYQGGLLTEKQEIGRSVRPEFIGLSEAACNRIVACYQDDRYIIAYDYQASSGANTRTLEFDLVGGKWDGPHHNTTNSGVSYFSVFDSQLDNEELVWGNSIGSSGSYIFIRDGSTYLDDGVPITNICQSGLNVLPGLEFREVIRAFASGRFSSDSYLELSIINTDGSKETAILLEQDQSAFGIWGISKWGQAIWGGVLTKRLESPLGPKARGSKVSIELTNKGRGTSIEVEEILLHVNDLRII